MCSFCYKILPTFCVSFLLFIFLFPRAIQAASLTIDPNSLTFSPNLSKRISHGPFKVGVYLQGDPANQDALVDDSLVYGRGSFIGSYFWQTFDSSQGTIVLWWTPEYSSTNLSSATNYLWYGSSTFNLGYDYANQRFTFTVGGQSMTVDSTVTAGTAYSLVLRFDTNNVISPSNYACLSIDDSHTCGINTAPMASSSPVNFYIGSDSAAQAASGLIEGLTVYRRVLFDGSSGTDIGFGDEINAIYNGGSGRDPVLVTGAQDVLVSVPFDSTVGALSSGSGGAWTYPHADNLLDNGFLLDSSPWTDWNVIGSPSSSGANPGNQQIFSGGNYWTSNATDQGYSQDVSVTLPSNFFARALVHADSSCIPRLELYNQTDSVSLGYIDGPSNTSRTSPSQLIITGRMPGSGNKTLQVRLLNTASSGTCYWHTIELLPNSYTDPSFETGSSPTSVGTPNSSAQAISPTRTGTSSWELVSNAADEGVTKSISTTAGNFYSLGGYVYPVSGAVYLNQSLQDGSTATRTTSATGGWEILHGVAQATGSSLDSQWLTTGAQTFYLDDFWVIPLANVALTASPASLTHSQETPGLRIDGHDTALQSITQLGIGSGTIKFIYTPRHSAASVMAFQENASSNVFIGEWASSANDTIQLYWSNPNTLTLRTVRNGTASSADYDATGMIVAGQTYYFEIDYTQASGDLRLKIDGPTRASLTGLSTFSIAPDTAYWGSNQSGALQADGLFASWEDPQLSFSVAAVSSNIAINGITTSVASTTTSLPFGNITAGVPKFISHQLSASTNSNSGYTVTMNILSTNLIQGLDPSNFIDPFSPTGASWSTPVAWTSPDGTTANVNTGWIGANTTDTRVPGWSSGYQLFGPVSTTPHPIMYSAGADSGTVVHITYGLEANVLQPTDTYSGQIIYTITPTY